MDLSVPDRLPSYAANGFAFLVALLPLLVVPFASVDTSLQKGLIAAFGAGLALLASGVAILLRARINIRMHALGIATFVFFAVVIFSALLSSSGTAHAWWGLGFEEYTVGGSLLFVVAVFAGMAARESAIRVSLLLFVAATAAVSLYALASLALDRTTAQESTLAGAWPQFSFLAAAAALAATILQEDARGRMRPALLIALIPLMLGTLAFFNTPAVFLLVTFLVGWIAFRFVHTKVISGKISFSVGAAALALLLSLIMLFGYRSPFQLPPDVRPTLFTTQRIAAPAILERIITPIIGTGPNTFSAVWERHRPMEFNMTPFWERSFEAGYSTAVTFAVTFGLLGVLTFLAIPTIGFASFARALFANNSDPSIRRDAGFSAWAFVMLFAFASHIISTPGLVTLLIGGFAAGLCARLVSVREFELPPSGARRMTRLAAGGFCVAAGFLLTTVAGQQFAGASFHSRGIAAHIAGDVPRAAELLERAAFWWSASLYERDAARVSLEAVFANPPADPRELDAAIGSAVTHAEKAIWASPKSYVAWLSRASLNISLIIAGKKELEPVARESIAQAKMLSPSRPEPHYLLAELEQFLGNRAAARDAIDGTFRLKPDYEPALRLRDRLTVVGDIQ